MKEILIEPNEKQKRFFESTARFTAYGGARGGGKSWAMRIKFLLLALGHDGISILLLRRTLGEKDSEEAESHTLEVSFDGDGEGWSR